MYMLLTGAGNPHQSKGSLGNSAVGANQQVFPHTPRHFYLILVVDLIAALMCFDGRSTLIALYVSLFHKM